MVRILLYALLIWFLYNLIFRFIIPVYKTTRQVKQKFREMQEQMQNQAKQQQGYAEKPFPEKTAPQKSSGDYIDFEEVK